MNKTILYYEGPLDMKRGVMAPEAFRGYRTFWKMKQRSKKAGLHQPEMSVREFVGWWLNEMKTFKGKTPSVSRLDHSKGYSWDNFIIEELIDNIREAAQRNKFGRAIMGTPKKIVYVYRKDGVYTGRFSSLESARDFFKITKKKAWLMAAKNAEDQNINFKLSYNAPQGVQS